MKKSNKISVQLDVVWAGPSAICQSFFRIAGKEGVGSGALLNILRVNRQL